MKNVVLALLSKYVSENMDWLIQKYSKDGSLLKSFIYKTMCAMEKKEDRKLANMLYEQLEKIPEERRKETIKLLISDAINYMSNPEEKYFSVIMDINSNCNMRCPNCANGEVNLSQNVNWSLDEINFAVNKIKPYSKLIFVSGGEPFMNENLIYAMKSNPNIEFVVFTNGSMTERYEELVRENLNNVFIMVSIDGKKEDHDKKRGEGSFCRSVENIAYLRESGFLCGIASVIEEPSIDYILSEEYINFAKALDVNTVYLLKDAHNRDEEFKENYMNLSKKMEDTAFKNFPVFNVPYSEKTLSKDNECFAGRQWFRINADFELTACPFSKTTYGNLKDYDIKCLVKKLKNNREKPQSSC